MTEQIETSAGRAESEFEFIEQRRRDAETAREKKFRNYAVLLAKECAGEVLTPAEAKRFDEILAALEIGLDQLRADAAIFKKSIALEQQSAPLADLEAVSTAANELFRNVVSENSKAITALHQHEAKVRGEAVAASNAVKPVKAAADALTAHRQKHWRLLGREDPAVAGRRRHIAMTLFGRPAGRLEFELFEFEQCFRPDANLSLDKFEFVALSTQTDADVAALVDLAVQIRRSGLSAMYLGTAEQVARAHRRDVIRTVGDLAVDGRDEDSYILLPPPGDSADTHGKRIAELKKAVAALRRVANVGPETVEVIINRTSYVSQMMAK